MKDVRRRRKNMHNETINSQPKVRMSKVLLVLCLSAAMVMGTMPCAPFVKTARAEETEKTITCLGSDDLSQNCADVGAATVYYGKHVIWDGGSLAWRVINYDDEGALFNGNADNLTLFASKILLDTQFSVDSNHYSTSELKSCIDYIYDRDFTETEKTAIQKRELFSGVYVGIDTDCIAGDPLTGEDAPYLWPLSSKEAKKIREKVGDNEDNYLKAKTKWWLRSPSDAEDILSGMDVTEDGIIRYHEGDHEADVRRIKGVRPAFNIGLDSVISTSLVSGNKGEPGAEYKLTIKDDDLSVSIGNNLRISDNEITLPYVITDNSTAEPTQLSMLVTKGNTTWTDKGWHCSQDGERISYLQYTKLDMENFSLSGNGTFTLDTSITGTLGEDYHVYILAEDVNGEHETDYASPPLEIRDPSTVWVYAADQEFTYDGKPHGISVNVTYPANGVTVKYGESAENCSLDASPVITNASESPKTIYYTAEADGYVSVSGSAIVTINKADSHAATVSANNRTYDGTEKPLVTVDSSALVGGTMQYTLGTEAEPVGDFTDDIPKGTDAGTYYVWYRVKGDDNHKDTDPQSVCVNIAEVVHQDVVISKKTKYGLSESVDISGYIEEGGSVSENGIAISGDTGIFESDPQLQDNKISYKLANVSGNAGKHADISVEVTGAKRYSNKYKIIVSVNVIGCDHLHTELRDVRGGTCSEAGYSGNIYCLDCGEMIEVGKATEKDPDNHHFDFNDESLKKVKREPTLLQMGIHTYTCAWCKKATMDLEDIPCLPDSKNRDLEELRKDVAGLSGNAAPVIENGKDENGNDTETVKIGGEEVSKTVTDKDTGKETIVSKVWIGGLQDSYCYTGSAIKPAFHVYDGTKQLKEKTDYTVSYKNNKDAGSATIEIKFKGNYKDTKAETLSFTISKAELGKDIIAHEVGVAQKKSAQKPVPVLTWAATGKTVSSKNFDISYSPSTVKAAGEYTATITPKSGSGSKNFSGSTSARLVVTTKDKVLSNAKVTFDAKSYAYTGSAVTPKYSLKLDGRTLTENTDYRLKDICNNTAPGTATVIFEGTGSYVGTKSATFKISGKIELKDSSDFTYTYSASVPFVKGGAKPVVSVRDNRNKVNLKEGKDYTVSYSKNKSIAGTPEIKIKGKGNYKGTVSRTFTITQQDISKLTITATDQFVKKSKLKKATVTIYDKDGNKLSSGKDFIVGANGTPVGDDNTGTVTVSITGSGNYTGDTTATFRYLDSSANIGKAGTKNKIPDQSYTGNAVKLSYADLTNVLYTGSKSAPTYLIPGTDFEIASYSNNTKRGTAKVVLKGKGSYAGTKTLTFKIVRRKVDYTGKL